MPAVARGTRAKASAARPRKSSAAGHAVEARFERRADPDPGAWVAAAAQARSAAEQREGERAGRRQRQPPAEPAEPRDRQREQRFQARLGFLVAGGRDLGAGEEADREGEDQEVEAERALRR